MGPKTVRSRHPTSTHPCFMRACLCPVCDRLVSLPLYQSHVRSHALARQCQMTARRRLRPRSERQHRQKFACPDCGKRLGSRASLTQHGLTHSRPFSCQLCRRRFSQRGNLLGHLRAHTGERPFTCRYCRRRFSQQANLHTHRKIHLHVIDFRCSLCAFASVQKINLVTHLTRVHSAGRAHYCARCRLGFVGNSCPRHGRQPIVSVEKLKPYAGAGGGLIGVISLGNSTNLP